MRTAGESTSPAASNSATIDMAATPLHFLRLPTPLNAYLHLKLPNDLFNGILFQLPDRPKAGTYQVVSDRGQELDGKEVFGGLLLPDVIYHASTGELRVTRTSPLRGTFQFEARRNGGVVTISGEFAQEQE